MKKTLLLITLFLHILICIGQESLRYNLKVGDTFTVLQEASQEITQQLPGTEQIINNKISGLLYFNVVDVAPDMYTVEISFKRFSMSMSSPTLGEMMSVDTEEPSEGIEFMMFEGMLNRPMEMLMKPTGEIVEIRNGDAIINGMIENMGELDDATKGIIKSQLEKEWKAEVLSESFEQMTFLYPETPKSTGDTWENSYAGEGKINAENVWTYKTQDNTNRNLTATADVTMNLSTDAITMKLSGTQTSDVTTTKENGFVIKLIVTGTASGDAVMPQAPNMIIPTTINSITTYTLQ